MRLPCAYSNQMTIPLPVDDRDQNATRVSCQGITVGSRWLLRIRCLLVLACGIVGCWSNTSDLSTDRSLEIAEFARTKQPAELMELILRGDSACGGPEGRTVLRAAYWLKRHDFQAALQHIANVTPDGPYRHSSLRIAGEALFRSGRLAQSLKLLSTLVTELPDDVDSHRILAAIYFDISAMNQAEIELQHVIRLAPEDYRPHHLLGRIHQDFEKFGTAVTHYRQALQLCTNPGSKLELQQGVAASLRGDRQFEELLLWLPPDEHDPLLETCRADALWSTGRSDEAERLLESIQQRAPEFAEALLLSARINIDHGKLDLAEKPLQTLLERNPHDVKARYQLALLQRQSGNLPAFQETMRLKDQSQALIDRMIQLNQDIINNPGDGSLCQQIADVCEQLGKLELAESWRKAVIGLNGQVDSQTKHQSGP